MPHLKLPIDVALSAELVEFFNLLGLKVTSVEMFFKRAKPEFDIIHIDDFDQTDRARINYVIEDSNSVMGFFRPKALDSGYLASGAAGGKPKRFNPHEVDLVYQHKIKKPSVIQTAIPHAVLNPHGIRYSLAVYLFDKNSNSNLTFNEARRVFQKYIVA